MRTSHSDPDLRPKKPQPTKNSDIDGRIPEDQSGNLYRTRQDRSFWPVLYLYLYRLKDIFDTGTLV